MYIHCTDRNIDTQIGVQTVAQTGTELQSYLTGVHCTDMNRADVTKQFYVLTGTELPIQVYRPKQSYLNRCTDRNRVT